MWDGHNPQGYLKALTNQYYWVPGQPIVCKCSHCGSPIKPSMENGDGFYAFKTVTELVKQRAHGVATGSRPINNTLIVGQVYLWGRIVECTQGYRAEKAYPKHLLVQDEDTKELLESIWKIPVEVGNLQQLYDKAMQAVGEKRKQAHIAEMKAKGAKYDLQAQCWVLPGGLRIPSQFRMEQIP